MLRYNRPMSIEDPHKNDHHVRGSVKRHPGWMAQPACLYRPHRQAGYGFSAAAWRVRAITPDVREWPG